jgi:hypothetical protein
LAGPISIKLRCSSWAQLSTIYKRDLSRGAIFLRTPKPPPIGTMVKIDMTLPSESMIVLSGVIVEHVGEGGMSGRGPGVDIKLATIPQSAMWLIETALASHKPAEPVKPPASEPAKPTGRAGSIVDAGLDDSADLADAETELVAALGAELASLQKLNPFQLLGVGYEVGDNEVRAAFGELTRRYHPDRYAKYPSLELRRYAAEIFILIRDAYRKLDSDAGRQKELATLGRSAVPRAVANREPSKSHVAPPPLPVRGGTRALPPPPPGGPGVRSNTPVGGVPILPQPGARKTPPAGVPVMTQPLGSRGAAGGLPQSPASRPPAQPQPPIDLDGLDSSSLDLAFTPGQGPGYLGNEPGRQTPSPPTAPTAMGARGVTMGLPRANLGGGDGKDLDQGALDALFDEGKYDEALALCRLAFRKNPGDRVARAGVELAEGLRALAGRDRLEAAQRFEVVLELDPSNERAARELADMRRQATNERKGLLTRLLGKKE